MSIEDTLKTIHYEIGEVKIRTKDGIPKFLDDRMNEDLMDDILALQEEAKAALAAMGGADA